MVRWARVWPSHVTGPSCTGGARCTPRRSAGSARGRSCSARSRGARLTERDAIISMTAGTLPACARGRTVFDRPPLAVLAPALAPPRAGDAPARAAPAPRLNEVAAEADPEAAVADLARARRLVHVEARAVLAVALVLTAPRPTGSVGRAEQSVLRVARGEAAPAPVPVARADWPAAGAWTAVPSPRAADVYSVVLRLGLLDAADEAWRTDARETGARSQPHLSAATTENVASRPLIADLALVDLVLRNVEGHAFASRSTPPRSCENL